MDKMKTKIGRVSKDWIEFDDGSKYKGQWLLDDKDGNGIFVDSDGAKYIGQFKGDLFHGKGVETSMHGKYDGEWKEGVRHGYGEEDWHETGDRYEGYYVEGARHGQGKLIYADGTLYQGQFD